MTTLTPQEGGISQIKKHKDDDQVTIVPLPPSQTLSTSSTTTSVSAALARSLFLFMGFMFRRPSKLFRPNRVDTWGALRQLAISSDQHLSPGFIRDLLRRKQGVLALTVTLLPPLMVNTILGFLLFTSHSFFSLSLARLPVFQRERHFNDLKQSHSVSKDTSPKGSPMEGDDAEEEEKFDLETLLRGPTVVPRHPTLLSGIAGAGAGIAQGIAFTPVENIVRLLKDSAQSITSPLIRLLHLSGKPAPGDEVSSPLQAIRNFLSTQTWQRSHSWWSGWRWVVARDALSYGTFFAAFDMTRRVGLRVKAFFGGGIQPDWENFIILDTPTAPSNIASSSTTTPFPSSRLPVKADPSSAPTVARVAQAATIVSGGIVASLLAEMIGRPFRACQKIMHSANSDISYPPSSSSISFRRHPVYYTYRTQGLRPFLHPDDPPSSKISGSQIHEIRFRRALTRVGWRLAAVGPWGFGFLVWAWVGGEV
ncbi:hypothetical protein M231_07448 [Tremella mesenterica]|uniref:Mitochondrial carrier protein n=1 Tax=Tremella mesenterica TaxID=5217 RepID=A0A4Q1B956_TREME|nr:uncharacterized protein TREMEDRAFT_25187 [Tremella mesenterica DSM 1558]EIW73170.1 hypothetical protein TREMEDRAFT_25187 [Tremella mesenterica DSM 1558]RXK35309.1 hypothetical protein M231_07448 [Tremella mesenterica]